MFKIQISNPEILSFNTKENINLEDALEAIFPQETEYAFLVWNDKYIPLNYKYDISLMVLDFIRIIDFLRDEHAKTLEIHWPSNTFASSWYLEKKEDFIKIQASWRSVIGGLEDLLNKSGENKVDSGNLENEIIKLFSFLKNALDKSNIDRKTIIDFDALENA